MSKFKTRHLNENVKQGFLEDIGPAWHFAGIDVQGIIDQGWGFNGPVPMEVAYKALSFQPRHVPVATQAINEDGTLKVDLIGEPVWELSPKYQAVRLSTGEIAYMGTEQHRIQNFQDICLDKVLQVTDLDADLATVGFLGDGKMAFTSWRPRHMGRITIPGFSDIVAYINARTSTDGSLATSLGISLQIQVCDNTAAAAQRSEEACGRIFKMKNTTGFVFEVDKVRESLGLVLDQAEKEANDTAVMLEAFGNVPVDDAMFKKIMDTAFPVVSVDTSSGFTQHKNLEGRSLTIAMNKRGEVARMYRNDLRVPESIHGTLLGVYQAFNTHGNWGESIKGNKEDPISNQWKRTVQGQTADTDFFAIVRQLELAPALVGAA